MKIFSSVTQFKKFPHVVLTMGNFDGVHAGHQQLLSLVVDNARKAGGTSVVITYWPHSKVFFGKIKESDLLQTLDERFQSLEALGVDVVLVLPFTKELAQTNAADFIKTILVDTLGIKEIVVGYDSVFGHDRKGNKALLEEYGKREDFIVTEAPQVSHEGVGLSSTRIRQEQEKI